MDINLKSPVQNNLLLPLMQEFLRRRSSKPVSISERDLARRYSTTAITIHKVCLSLAAAGLLIRLPEKRGFFINPDYGYPDDNKLQLGIICQGSTMGIWFNGRLFNLISAIGNCAGSAINDIFFIPLNPKQPEDLAAKIKQFPSRCFIWLCPAEKDIPLFNHLIREKLPVIGISALFDTDLWTPPEKNALIRDYYTHGTNRAELMLRKNCRKPLYIGTDIPGGTFAGFHAALAEAGIPFASRQRLEFDNDFFDRFAAAFRRFSPDCIVANGLIRHFISKMIEEIPEAGALPFFVEDDVLDSEMFRNIKIYRTVNLRKLYQGIARKTLEQIEKIGSGTVPDFENIILTDVEKEASSITYGG